jgi:cold shock CspA family protein
MQQGKVRWYSAQGYGFIDPIPSADGKALYFHINDVPSLTILKAGDEVTFDTVQAPKGLKCVNVQAVKTKEVIQCPQQTT